MLIDRSSLYHDNDVKHFPFSTDPPLDIVDNYTQQVSYNGSISITLPNTTAVTGFNIKFNMLWVVVGQHSSSTRVKRSTSSMPLEINGETTYVTAKLAMDDLNSTFIVGDGEYYGGVENRNLTLGNYTVYVGYKAVTEETVTQFYQLNTEPLQGL